LTQDFLFSGIIDINQYQLSITLNHIFSMNIIIQALKIF